MVAPAQMWLYRLVILDESHNLRNREGKTYKAILEYIQRSGSKCILLSATPFNKEYLDLASQLRLFVSPDKELEIGPERLLHDVDRVQFRGRYQCGANTLAAFEKSQYPDDWRDLICLDREDCATWHRFAARVKLRSSAIARKYCIFRNSISTRT